MTDFQKSLLIMELFESKFGGALDDLDNEKITNEECNRRIVAIFEETNLIKKSLDLPINSLF